MTKVEELPHHAPGHRRGSASATAALGTLDYPISKDQAIAKVGDWQVPVEEGRKVPLRDFLERMPVETLNNLSDAVNAVDHYWGDVV